MQKYCILYNYYSGRGKGYLYAKEVENLIYADEYFYQNMPDIISFSKFLEDHKEDLIICGGDGTLNYFVNKLKDCNYSNKIFYYPTGTGNDFHNDLGKIKVPYDITEEVKNLPRAIINGEELVFLNGVGGGLDGFVCKKVIDKKKKGKSASYTTEAIKGLYTYKPSKIKIIIDKKEITVDNAWMVSVMLGKYYGGGMMLAPNQNRYNKNKKLTIVVLHSKKKLKMLSVFPKVFTGKHIKYKDMISFYEGNDIEIVFSKYEDMQIDGEVIEKVKSCKVKSI